jgi:hypothetical protein
MRVPAAALCAVAAVLCACGRPVAVVAPTPVVARVIVPTRAGSEIEVRVGEVIRVRRPADFTRWQLDYAGDILRPVGRPGEIAEPGPEGWTFTVIGAGVCELRLTAEVAPGPAGPVSPSPPQFTLTIRSTQT